MQRKKIPQALPALSVSALPRHVAVIMDGNGRWAKRHGQPRAFGHRAGVEALRAVIRESSDLGIRALSLYAFSTENWARPAEEVRALMGLLLEFFGKEIEELHKKNVRITILGDVAGMPAPQREALCEAMARTQGNTGLRLNIALNYGGRADIVQAAQALARQAVSGEIAPEDISEARFAQALYTGDLPDVDLLIRTSGEQRLSNFLLYQCAYAEFVFTDVLWPDFGVDAYRRALAEYGRRARRFGGLGKEQARPGVEGGGVC
ncbi:MAG: isoprenyl transferase [Oscillospiraceae bacterium]|nr:isoprenyl transferase [Oscillospiraceae bacterium]